MNKKKLRNRILATSLALCFTASALPLSSSVVVNAAQVEDNSIVAAGTDHTLSASNNYDISKELIMPGESFRIEPQYEVFHTVGYYGQDVTNLWLYNASLALGDVSIISKLVRNTADVSGIEEITGTYNVIKMAYERGDLIGALAQMPEDPELREELEQALQEALNKETTVTVGYVNNTSTPIVLQQVRTTSSKSEGVLYGGEYGKTPIVEAVSTHKSDCTIKFFEPYYMLSYSNLLEGEEEGLPDRYYIQHEKQELVLPNLVRPGYHFDKWNGGMYFADQEKVGDTTVLSFDWENNLANAGYNFGDETLYPVFEDGYTVTFNPNGGTIDGKESAIYELDTESESFFDIGDYVPEREGYTFLGWCYKPAALYDSLIEDTSNYDWMNNTSGYNIQLYAKWAEESDKELELNGFRLDEETGELTIVSDIGVKGWKSLCNSTNNECKEKVKSAFVGGNLTTVPAYIFSECENLKSVVLPETVKDIYDYAFENCSSLEAIEMPGVKSISPNAFCDCTSLKSIEMPLIKRIYGNAFENCTSLETVTLPPQTEYIGEQAFYKCSQLCEVVFERTDYDENEDYFYVSADAFEECHPDLFILVQPSMLNLFKETFMPEYADIITDEVPVREVTDVVIYNAPTSCTVGEAPKKTATKVDSEAYTFYEYWEEWAQTENGLEPVKYWYSDAQQMSRVPADKRITAFEKGKTYSYSIIAQANENYTFASKDALSVMLNGEDFTAKSEVILDGKSLMIGPGKFMKPVEQKEIEVVEINNATLTFMDGDKPVFTGTTPDGAPYVIEYEGWFGEDGEFICSSDYWNSAYVERGWCDGLISTFKNNTEYTYQLYLKLTDEAAAQGYVFGPNTQLSVNGNIVEYPHSGETSVALQISTNLTMVASTKYVPQKEIEVVEINNATLTFMDGDKPVFTGTTPDGAPYVLVFEEWRTDGEWTRSDEWFNDDDHHGDDKDITAFDKNKIYNYNLYLKTTAEGSEDGWYFGPNTKLKINGKEVSFTNDDPEAIQAFMVTTGITMTPTEKTSLVIGDANMDGEITVTDATLIQKFCVGLATPENETARKLADVNGDGTISITDATLIQKYLVGGFSDTGNAGKYLSEI